MFIVACCYFDLKGTGSILMMQGFSQNQIKYHVLPELGIFVAKLNPNVTHHGWVTKKILGS